MLHLLRSLFVVATFLGATQTAFAQVEHKGEQCALENASKIHSAEQVFDAASKAHADLEFELEDQQFMLSELRRDHQELKSIYEQIDATDTMFRATWTRLERDIAEAGGKLTISDSDFTSSVPGFDIELGNLNRLHDENRKNSNEQEDQFYELQKLERNIVLKKLKVKRIGVREVAAARAVYVARKALREAMSAASCHKFMTEAYLVQLKNGLPEVEDIPEDYWDNLGKDTPIFDEKTGQLNTDILGEDKPKHDFYESYKDKVRNSTKFIEDLLKSDGKPDPNAIGNFFETGMQSKDDQSARKVTITLPHEMLDEAAKALETGLAAGAEGWRFYIDHPDGEWTQLTSSEAGNAAVPANESGSTSAASPVTGVVSGATVASNKIVPLPKFNAPKVPTLGEALGSGTIAGQLQKLAELQQNASVLSLDRCKRGAEAICKRLSLLPGSWDQCIEEVENAERECLAVISRKGTPDTVAHCQADCRSRAMEASTGIMLYRLAKLRVQSSVSPIDLQITLSKASLRVVNSRIDHLVREIETATLHQYQNSATGALVTHDGPFFEPTGDLVYLGTSRKPISYTQVMALFGLRSSQASLKEELAVWEARKAESPDIKWREDALAFWDKIVGLKIEGSCVANQAQADLVACEAHCAEQGNPTATFPGAVAGDVCRLATGPFNVLSSDDAYRWLQSPTSRVALIP